MLIIIYIIFMIPHPSKGGIANYRFDSHFPIDDNYFTTSNGTDEFSLNTFGRERHCAAITMIRGGSLYCFGQGKCYVSSATYLYHNVGTTSAAYICGTYGKSVCCITLLYTVYVYCLWTIIWIMLSFVRKYPLVYVIN